MDDKSATPEAVGPFIRVKQITKIIDIDKATWWDWHKRGWTPKGIKISHRITLFREEEVMAFVKVLTEKGLAYIVARSSSR